MYNLDFSSPQHCRIRFVFAAQECTMTAGTRNVNAHTIKILHRCIRTIILKTNELYQLFLQCTSFSPVVYVIQMTHSVFLLWVFKIYVRWRTQIPVELQAWSCKLTLLYCISNDVFLLKIKPWNTWPWSNTKAIVTWKISPLVASSSSIQKTNIYHWHHWGLPVHILLGFRQYYFTLVLKEWNLTRPQFCKINLKDEISNATPTV